ncbi:MULTISPECIES: DUF4339 domain-containing protein [unclassified Microcoleus]|uniref:DUF4339 domain-containing protein n=1 Tax=unclassified Microcoleus TaxID=2642155 RepID=UPI002FCE7FA2
MNNWPKFLPDPTSWARGFALSISFWLIVSLLWPNAYYYSYRFSRAYWYTIRSSDFQAVITFAWLCQILLFAFYHWGVTKVTEWVEIRRHNQQPPAILAWQHWREGIIAFLMLPAAILMGIPAIAIFMLPVNSSSGALISLILGTAIASAYLYHFRFAKLLKNLFKFLWIFYAELLKILELLLVPVLTGTPFFLLTVATAEIVPKQLLPLTTFLLVICVLLSGIVGYAALQYLSAHLVNWAATWWPADSPGYSRLQARKAWKHNRTATSQSFVRHTTSWHLAANDATNLIYLNLIAIVLGAIAFLLFGESSEWSETQEEILGSAVALVWVAVWHFWGWPREVEIARGKPEAKKSQSSAKKKRSPNSNSPPPNPVEQELNQLKATTGMNRMKSVRRSTQPTPEVPQWYVFRSGEAKGPYTRLQLWEVQEITARSKVRRGEAEWQRAGEIPELASYLTQK